MIYLKGFFLWTSLSQIPDQQRHRLIVSLTSENCFTDCNVVMFDKKISHSFTGLLCNEHLKIFQHFHLWPRQRKRRIRNPAKLKFKLKCFSVKISYKLLTWVALLQFQRHKLNTTVYDNGKPFFFALRHDVVFIKICIPITRENAVMTLGFTHVASLMAMLAVLWQFWIAALFLTS